MKRHSTPTVIVVDYDPCWPAQFETLRSRIVQALGDIGVSVEHVGSTSVPGLAAKPVIDIDVVVASVTEMALAIERLATLGYVYRGNLGIDSREAFESPSGLPAHNLYACLQGSTALENHLTIRDYLRRNSDAAATYGTLKKQLAEQFPGDIGRYIEGKTDFLLRILRESGFSDRELSEISDVNRAKS